MWDVSWLLMTAGQAACILEADAPKIGNVNRQYDYKDCLLEDFHISAVLMGRALAEVPDLSVGQSIYQGVLLTRQAVPTNTNLGILLLLVPLAKAWSNMKVKEASVHTRSQLRPQLHSQLRSHLEQVLKNLSLEDSCYAYRGIRLARPSGLGEVADYDVTSHDNPDITLYEAMALSADRDLIALQYVTEYKILFEEVIPKLEEELFSDLGGMIGIAQIGLDFLSKHHDSLIYRKNGLIIAEEVRSKAEETLNLGGWYTSSGRQGILEFDDWLRGHSPRLNPGTTADFIAAALFVLFLEHGPMLWSRIRSRD